MALAGKQEDCGQNEARSKQYSDLHWPAGEQREKAGWRALLFSLAFRDSFPYRLELLQTPRGRVPPASKACTEWGIKQTLFPASVAANTKSKASELVARPRPTRQPAAPLLP